jgi:phosphoribosylamine--glycine ligase
LAYVVMPGGMGTIAPNPCYTPEMAKVCMDTIFLPTLAAMRAEGCPFKGCLYFGLMLTPKGPKVIEYNCRFGDPETQVVLPLLKTDLLTVMRAVESGTLGQLSTEWRSGAAACVILASGGYPGHYEKGKVITLPDTLPENITVYHAGDALTAEGALVTSGGRVLGVTATADTLEAALRDAYAAAGTIDFEGKYLRRDIGRRALALHS